MKTCLNCLFEKETISKVVIGLSVNLDKSCKINGDTLVMK